MTAIVYSYLLTLLISLFYERRVSAQDRENCVRRQYSETNVMHVLLNLLRINDLYMFRTLLAHPQEVLHKRHLVLCQLAAPGLEFHSKSGAAY
jgi:hypothetical protein